MQQGLQYKNTLFLLVKSWSFFGLGFYVFYGGSWMLKSEVMRGGG